MMKLQEKVAKEGNEAVEDALKVEGMIDEEFLLLVQRIFAFDN